MLKIKAKPYEFMVVPTLQKAWIEGKGVLLWLGLFFIEFGAALFLVSSFFDCRWGEIAGWLIAAILGGGSHFAFLGHPFRIFKAIKRPGSAWISRGLIIISLFLLSALIHLLFVYFSEPVFWLIVLTDIMAVVTILYGGFEVADVKHILAWNSSFIPVQMLLRSFFLALAVMLVAYLLSGVDTIAHNVDVKNWLQATILINIGLFIIYLISLGFGEGKHTLALSMMLKGDLKSLFWPFVGICGIIIPLLLTLYTLIIGAETVAGIFLISVVLLFVADPLLRYCMLRSGYYQGLPPCKPSQFNITG